MGWFTPDPTPLELEITRVTTALKDCEIGSEEYQKVLGMVKALRQMKDESAAVNTLAEIGRDIRQIKHSLEALDARTESMRVADRSNQTRY